MKYLIRTLIVVVIIIGGFLVFIYSGIYNVSAMVPHNKLTLWVINTVKDNSIDHHSEDIKVPDLSDTSLVRIGFINYRDMCVGCHGAPGIKRDEAGQGLYPKPPNLANSAKDTPPKQLFWITKNGIKFTGMPSFGKTQSDKKIWSIVAFIERLPYLDADKYKEMDKKVKNEMHD